MPADVLRPLKLLPRLFHSVSHSLLTAIALLLDRAPQLLRCRIPSLGKSKGDLHFLGQRAVRAVVEVGTFHRDGESVELRGEDLDSRPLLGMGDETTLNTVDLDISRLVDEIGRTGSDDYAAGLIAIPEVFFATTITIEAFGHVTEEVAIEALNLIATPIGEKKVEMVREDLQRVIGEVMSFLEHTEDVEDVLIDEWIGPKKKLPLSDAASEKVNRIRRGNAAWGGQNSSSRGVGKQEVVGSKGSRRVGIAGIMPSDRG